MLCVRVCTILYINRQCLQARDKLKAEKRALEEQVAAGGVAGGASDNSGEGERTAHLEEALQVGLLLLTCGPSCMHTRDCCHVSSRGCGEIPESHVMLMCVKHHCCA
jgi:hypothetical protein